MKFRVSLFILALFTFPLLLACGGGDGGLFNGDPGINPLGFTFSSNTNIVGATSHDIRALALNKAGTKIYVGTDKGLFTSDAAAVTPVFTAVNDLVASTVHALLFDSSGDLLVGTDNGLFRQIAASGSFAAVSPAELAGKRVLSIVEPASGTIYVGLDNVATAVYQITGGTATGIMAHQGKLHSIRSMFAEPSTTKVLLADQNSGVYRIVGGALEPRGNLASGATFVGMYDSAWLAGGNGSHLFSSADFGDTWTETNLKNATVYGMIRHPSPVSGLAAPAWFATDKGVYVTYNLSDFTLFTGAHGLAKDACSALSYSNRVWIGHAGVGGGISQSLFTGN